MNASDKGFIATLFAPADQTTDGRNRSPRIDPESGG